MRRRGGNNVGFNIGNFHGGLLASGVLLTVYVRFLTDRYTDWAKSGRAEQRELIYAIPPVAIRSAYSSRYVTRRLRQPNQRRNTGLIG